MKTNLIYHTQITMSDEHNGSEKVSIEVSNKTAINAFFNTISKDGMTITCDQHTLHALLPNKESIAPKQPVTLPVTFSLNQEIKATCNVICVRRLSKNIFELDMRFKDLAENDASSVNQYIESSLMKKQRLNANSPLSKAA